MQVRSNDTDIFFDVIGNGTPVIFLHPFPANHGFWLPVAGPLSTRYKIILPDLRGHGQSGPGEGAATMAKHAEDLARVCDACGVGRAAFVGCSIGGYILFEFWRRFGNRVEALALCNTKAAPDNDEARKARLQSATDVLERGPEWFIDSMVPKLIGETTRRNRPDLVEAARRIMMQSSAAGISAVQKGMAERPDSVPTLGTIAVPTLIIAGDEDQATPLDQAEMMRSGIRGSRLTTIRKAGHYAAFEQSQEVTQVLRDFLGAVPRR